MASFAIYKMVRRHSQKYLICNMICTQGISQSQWPILLSGINCLFQNQFDLSIGQFSLPIHLGMIGNGYLMSNPVLAIKVSNWPITKMHPLITHYCPRHPKPWKDILFKKLHHHLVVIGSSGDGISCSFGNVSEIGVWSNWSFTIWRDKWFAATFYTPF